MTALARWFDRFLALVVKELRQVLRDPILTLVVVYFFTFDIYVAGGGIRMDLHRGALWVLDHDHSTASRELIHRFRLPYFHLQGELPGDRQAVAALDQGRALVVLDIPPRFQHDLLQGRPTSVNLQVDAANVTLGNLVSSYAGRIVARFNTDRLLTRFGPGPLPQVRDQYRVYYNPNQRDIWFSAISELLMVVTMLALMLPAAVLVREKERGTIEQLAVSPLSPLQILLAKVSSMGLVLLLGTVVALGLVIETLFQVPVHGSRLLFLAVTALYVFASAGLGLVIAVLSRNLGQVVMLVLLLMMPLLLLSGIWTPPEAMPPLLRHFLHLSPLYYYVEMAYGILLKGAGIADLWPLMIQLTGLGSMIFAFGVWRFRCQFG